MNERVNKAISKLLTNWIPIRKLRRKAREHLVEFRPIHEYIKSKRIENYLKQRRERGKAKVVVYCAVSGDYDKLRSHYYLTDEFDYVLFTDSKEIKGKHAWEIKPMKEYDNKIPVRKARYYKMFPDKLFPDYEYSVWIDGKCEITGKSFESRVKEKIQNNVLISSCEPHGRDCIYQEAERCKELKKDDPNIIDKQIKFLKNENYPEHNGLSDTCILFRKHHDPKVKKAMNDWWDMIQKFSYRDQLSFCYVLWKNKIKHDILFQPPKESPLRYKSHVAILHDH